MWRCKDVWGALKRMLLNLDHVCTLYWGVSSFSLLRAALKKSFKDISVLCSVPESYLFSTVTSSIASKVTFHTACRILKWWLVSWRAKAAIFTHLLKISSKRFSLNIWRLPARYSSRIWLKQKSKYYRRKVKGKLFVWSPQLVVLQDFSTFEQFQVLASRRFALQSSQPFAQWPDLCLISIPLVTCRHSAVQQVWFPASATPPRPASLSDPRCWRICRPARGNGVRNMTDYSCIQGYYPFRNRYPSFTVKKVLLWQVLIACLNIVQCTLPKVLSKMTTMC